jgi:putative heme-binding domain-containing protein
MATIGSPLRLNLDRVPGVHETPMTIVPLKINEAGNEFGPDLTKLDPKQAPADLLRNILEPSAKINDKYYAYLFEMESGRVLTGLIVEETLAGTEPKVLKKSDISSRKQSPASAVHQLTRAPKSATMNQPAGRPAIRIG